MKDGPNVLKIYPNSIWYTDIFGAIVFKDIQTVPACLCPFVTPAAYQNT